MRKPVFLLPWCLAVSLLLSACQTAPAEDGTRQPEPPPVQQAEPSQALPDAAGEVPAAGEAFLMPEDAVYPLDGQQPEGEGAQYIYAVMDTAAMSREDLEAVGSYLSAIPDASILIADASAFSCAADLYAALRSDAAGRGGSVSGVQIFGTSDMVPSFPVSSKVELADGSTDDIGSFLTDLFYGNFENDPERISARYSIQDHFRLGWDVELIPRWPVARLPLSRGEFPDFFDRYRAFAEDTGLVRLDLVSFSSPGFANDTPFDDMGRFLERAGEEFRLLDVPCRLYGNQEGQYPVVTPVTGGFTLEEMAGENHAGAMELVLSGHGDWDCVLHTVFENDVEERTPLLTMDNISGTLDGYPYYLDNWSCLTGMDMKDNLITAALTGRCVGAFAATTELSNNGTDCEAPLSDLQHGNPFYFYYCYLDALHEGRSRSAAFFSAQHTYGKSLMTDSANGIQGEGNYQCGLRNLLAYHNFGILEPEAGWEVLSGTGGIKQAARSTPKKVYQRIWNGSEPPAGAVGAPQGEPRAVEFSVETSLPDYACVIHGCTVQALDDGCVRYTLDYTAQKGLAIIVIDPPQGSLFKLAYSRGTPGGPCVLTFDIQKSFASDAQSISIFFQSGPEGRCSVMLPPYGKS